MKTLFIPSTRVMLLFPALIWVSCRGNSAPAGTAAEQIIDVIDNAREAVEEVNTRIYSLDSIPGM